MKPFKRIAIRDRIHKFASTLKTENINTLENTYIRTRRINKIINKIST